MKILCIGEEWRGSNASGLFYALSRIGCITNIVNELKYISVHASKNTTKVANRVLRNFQISDFNHQLRQITHSFRPDVVLVYKGAFLDSDTIGFWKGQCVPVVNFFPDVSFLAHGSYIPECIPLYDHIMTTKTFATTDLYSHFNYSSDRVSFIPHGFDPQIHRRVDPGSSGLDCDVSFIGNFSAHKERYLSALANALPNVHLKIWGGTWNRSSTRTLKSAIQKVAVLGDLYALAINSSQINLALLSEKVAGASSGDQITSRTFHIPGSGGFMMHQRTDEVLTYFEEDKEMVCFSSEEEMNDKIDYYLVHDSERKRIQEAGYSRAVMDHSLDRRALDVLAVLKKFV